MSRQTLFLLFVVMVTVMLARLNTGDAKVAIKGCFVGYKRQGDHKCVFVGCPKGYNTITRSTGYGEYKFCVIPKQKPSGQHRGYVSPHLIFTYVRQRIRPCQRIMWLRRRLHRVWKRTKLREKDVKSTQSKVKQAKNIHARQAWEVVLKRLQADLTKERKALSLLLSQVSIMEGRRRVKLSLSYRKLRWWINRAEKRIKELEEKLSKRKTMRGERALNRWRYFLRKLKVYLMKVISIIRKRKFRGRLGYVWNKVRRVEMALKQIRAKLHKAKGRAEQKRLIKSENYLWTDLVKWKKELNKVLQSQNDIRRRRIQSAVHNLKHRIGWIHKKLAYIGSALKKAMEKKPRDARRVKWIKYILAKWNKYLAFVKRRYQHYAKQYEKLNKSKKDKNEKRNTKKKEKPHVVKSTTTKIHGTNDGLGTIHKVLTEKLKPSVTNFKYKLA